MKKHLIPSRTVVAALAAVLFIGLVFAACDGSSSPTAPTAQVAASSTSLPLKDSSNPSGCSPGYWKKHTASWPATGYSTAQSVPSVFAQAAAYPQGSAASLLEALNFHGGGRVEGAVRILLRAAVASLLNASHSGIASPRTAASVISDTNAALASGDRSTMLGLASALDADNNLDCPLN